MVQNSTQSLGEGDVDFRKIIRILLDSKKFILITAMCVAIVAFFYSIQKNPSYKSELLIEIGSYSNKLIQSPKDLVQDLKINYIYKDKVNLNLKINTLEDRLVIIELISDSSDKNTQLLNEIFDFVNNKHLNIVNKTIQSSIESLAFDIRSLNYTAENKKDLLESLKQINKQKISSRISNLSQKIPLISKKIDLINNLIIDDGNNLDLLKTRPELLIQRAADYPTLEAIIGNYKLDVIDLENQLSKTLEDIDNLENQLVLLENGVFESDDFLELSNEINTLNSEIRVLEYQIESKNNQKYQKTTIIGEIENSHESSMIRYLLLGFLIGIILSIFLVFMRNFSKEL